VLGRVFAPWRHPSTWWTLTHLVTDVVVGAVTFSFVVALLATTFGLLITFFLAIPVFWLLMVGSRGFAHVERSRASALLGLELLDPVAPLQGSSWWRRLLERARSAARWKEVGYLLLLLPLGVLNLVLVVAAWCGSLALLTLPLYVSALPEGSAKFWAFQVASGGDAWLVALVGLLGLVFLAPWVTVVLGRLDAVTCSWFLGPDERALQEARVRAAESGRAAAVGSAEAERRRIERDLHDGAQQRLVSLAMELGATREHFDDEDKETIRARVVHAHEEAKAALQEIRDLVRGIHPVILEDRGLDAALSAVVARAPIPVTLEVDVDLRPSPEVESAAYFVVSEALTNVARHSGATNAAVSLVRAGDTLVVEVRDNGGGGADGSADVGDGTGLAGLRERAASLGGSIHLDSPTGGPTILRAVLPCE
jgi:signal transduction histidine kinase